MILCTGKQHTNAMAALMHYRCYFVDASKGFSGAEEFQSDSDAMAVERAAALIRERGFHSSGFELWQGNRLVHRQPPIDHKI